jgi:Domain of unknown function (DUF4124)
MHLRLVFVGLLAMCAAAQAAVIYKWKDAGGVTHYSDQPTPGAEKVLIDSQPRVEAEPKTTPYALSHRAEPSNPAKPGMEPAAYADFEIYAPAPDAVLHTHDLDVHIRLEPPLAPRHQISLYLDGKRTDAISPDGTSFTVSDLERGDHTVQAVILDRDSGETRSSNNVSFQVMQTSVVTPPRGPSLPPRGPVVNPLKKP